MYFILKNENKIHTLDLFLHKSLQYYGPHSINVCLKRFMVAEFSSIINIAKRPYNAWLVDYNRTISRVEPITNLSIALV